MKIWSCLVASSVAAFSMIAAAWSELNSLPGSSVLPTKTCPNTVRHICGFFTVSLPVNSVASEYTKTLYCRSGETISNMLLISSSVRQMLVFVFKTALNFDFFYSGDRSLNSSLVIKYFLSERKKAHTKLLTSNSCAPEIRSIHFVILSFRRKRDCFRRTLQSR